jgi:hypothetical protein
MPTPYRTLRVIEIESQLTIQNFFEVAPKSEKTITRNKFVWHGVKFVNDLGACCDYRIISPKGRELGVIRYFRGRKLSSYELVKES